MKRFIALLLALLMMLTLCACGKKKKKEKTPEETVPAVATPVPNDAFEVKITLDNLFDWFDYKEFRADVKEENTGEVTSCTVNYGLQLKPAFTAANDPKHRDTMTIWCSPGTFRWTLPRKSPAFPVPRPPRNIRKFRKHCASGPRGTAPPGGPSATTPAPTSCTLRALP